MHIEAAFRPLIQLERVVGELYERWADAFEPDREAAFVWVRMANEEKGHVSLVEYQRRVVQRNPQITGDVDIDLGAVHAAIERVRAALEAPPPTLPDALRLAYELETSAAESHFRNALKDCHPELQRLLECLGGEDRRHLERLTDLASRRGIALEGASLDGAGSAA